MAKQVLIFLISLLIPSSKPCLLNNNITACIQSLPQLEPKLKFANKFIRSPLISDLLSLIPKIKPFTPHINYLLGQEKPTTYLILLQNDNEIRANGGFFGSYAVITVSPGMVASTLDSSQVKPPKISFRFQDIYVPDGQIAGHVDPPEPIQKAFKQGWYRLRDSDWEPDFIKSAATIRWFFEKGGEIKPDFLVTLNLSTIKKILAIVGDINVPEYDTTINQNNIYSLLQSQSEINFFPGSTQKKDALTATGRALIKKLSNLELTQYLELVQILKSQLDQQNLLVNSLNPDIQKILEEKNWAGQITHPVCDEVQSPGVCDVYLLVETNLGANKANCCVNRNTKHKITTRGKVLHHQVSITFTNSSPLENPSPPRFYGGNYISYLRFYIPEIAQNIKVSAKPTLPKTLKEFPSPKVGEGQGEVSISSKYSLTEIGFFHLTAAGTQSTVSISYEVSPGTVARRDSPQVKPSYQLSLLKQHGLESSPQKINLFGKDYSTNLENNFTISSSITP